MASTLSSVTERETRTHRRGPSQTSRRSARRSPVRVRLAPSFGSPARTCFSSPPRYTPALATLRRSSRWPVGAQSSVLRRDASNEREVRMGASSPAARHGAGRARVPAGQRPSGPAAPQPQMPNPVTFLAAPATLVALVFATSSGRESASSLARPGNPSPG